MLGLLVPVLILAAPVTIVRDVRTAIAKNDLARAEKLVQEFRARNGATPEAIEAQSWLARGAFAAKDFEKAEAHAGEARRLTMDALKNRRLDDDRHLPTALGAAIEVRGNVLAARGERDEAVVFLREELERWRGTSIRTRIQKNINLLSLEGKPAPRIPGVDPAGRPMLVFLWAHWCEDCKAMAPALERIGREFAPKGLRMIGPTQLYGYKQRGEEATPAVEREYVEQVRAKHFGNLEALVDAEVFRNYGASTTPTIVLIDRRGTVRLYHPGEMTYEELAPKVEQIVRPLGRAASAS